MKVEVEGAAESLDVVQGGRLALREACGTKTIYWRDWKRQHGPAAGIRIADELRRQVLRMRPGWPSARERQADLAAHLRVIEALRRVPPRRR